MTMASGVYGLQLAIALNKTAGAYDLNTDTLKGALFPNTPTPDFDVWDFFNDHGTEIAGTGYTAGGNALTTVVSAAVSPSLYYKFDADDFSWPTSTLTNVRGDCVYSTVGGTAATNPLLLTRTYGADFSTVAGTFAVTQDALGLWRVKYA